MGSRLTALPTDHLEAELCAYPLASEAAFEQHAVELCPELGQPATRKMWRRAEKELLSSWPAVSLDECIAMRDRFWFLDESTPLRNTVQPITLVRYLRSISNRILRRHGSSASPHLLASSSEPVPRDDAQTRARSAWRWLSFALPTDLLLAGLHNDAKGSPPHRVETLVPALERLLSDHGFAETHLHLWAALEFPVLWVATQRALAQAQLGCKDFQGPGACFDEGKNLGSWLLRAAIARYFLAAFLEQRGEVADFFDFTKKRTQLITRTIGAGETAVLGAAFDELAHGRLDANSALSYATLRSIYRQLIRPITKFPEDPDDVWSIDPIAPLVPWSRGRGASPEIGFLCRGFEYLENTAGKDRPFALLFWQVVRVRNLFFRHVVHRPMTPGLQWFIRTFQRMKPGRRPISPQLQLRCAADLCGHGHGLRSLEVRTSPEGSLGEMVALMRNLQRPLSKTRGEHERQQQNLATEHPFSMERPSHPREDRLATGAQAWYPEGSNVPRRRASDSIEIGIVFHLPRNRRGGWTRGLPTAHWRGSHADPSYEVAHPGFGNSTGFRYARFYRNRRKEARALSRLLTTFPASLQLIRGVDVCADEQGVPVWVLAPLIRLIHDAGEQAAKVLRRCFARDVPPLRTTVHAGEDFTHLLTGLRRLDESVEFFNLRAGDRLGHALALGVEPSRWAERAGRILVSREKRLFDLSWEWSWHARCGSTPAGRHEQMEREMARHSKALFGRELTPTVLEDFRRALCDESTLRYLGFPDRLAMGNRESLPAHPTTENLVLKYLTSHEMFRHGRKPVRVDPVPEAETLLALQNGLRRKIGKIGLTIEINPSSNLLIGNLGELRHHPLWRLRPPGNQDEVAPLDVCVGSDDPLTFGARLAEEYQLLHDALLSAGHSEAEALDWLDTARRAGLKNRFTLAGTPPKIEHWVFGGEPPLKPPP